MIQSRLNPALVSLLLALIGLISVIILAEWLVIKYARHDLLQGVNQAVSSGYEIEEIPKIELLKSSLEDFDDMVNRPLFVEGRRPIVVVESVPDKTEVIFTGKFDWELTGVFTTDMGMSALFVNKKARERKEKFSRVFVNDDLDGWKIEEIRNDRVVVSHLGSSQEIKLYKPRPARKSKPKQLARKRLPSKNRIRGKAEREKLNK